MRKIIVSEMVTVDGFFAGPQGEIDWHMVDQEFNTVSIEQLNSADMLLFGRVTYDLMASYWPTTEGLKDDPVIAEKMNSLKKLVYTKTLDKLDWNNSEVIHEIDAEEVLKLKQEPGKDILIFGSGTIVSALADLGLIDEYRLTVNPIILGKGKTLFAGIKQSIKLNLIKTRPLTSGNVILYYTPAI